MQTSKRSIESSESDRSMLCEVFKWGISSYQNDLLLVIVAHKWKVILDCLVCLILLIYFRNGEYIEFILKNLSTWDVHFISSIWTHRDFTSSSKGEPPTIFIINSRHSFYSSANIKKDRSRGAKAIDRSCVKYSNGVSHYIKMIYFWW